MIDFEPLLREIEAIAPIASIGYGDQAPDDKLQWQINFKDEATAEQRAATQAVIAGFDVARLHHREQRYQAIENDPDRLDLVDKLQNKTSAEIDAWIDTNVTNVAQVQRALKMILKILARR